MTSIIRVLIADNYPLFRAGVSHVLGATGEFEIVGEVGDAQQAVKLSQQLMPDVVLLDVTIPGCGLTAAREIKRTNAAARLVFLTMAESEESVNAALELGAQGYLLKGASGLELARVLHAVCGGESYVAPGLAARLLSQLRQKPKGRERNVLSDLTSREEQILAQVALGLTNKDIARVLVLSEKTVKHYMTSVLNKLNVRNRVEAVVHMHNNAPH